MGRQKSQGGLRETANLIAFVLPRPGGGHDCADDPGLSQSPHSCLERADRAIPDARNIHYVGTNGLAIYLITSPQGHILIDTGLPEATPQIKSSIAKLGFKVADIKYLLNTHAHFDHTGGFAELKKETGAQLIAGTGDRPLLEGGYYPARSRPWSSGSRL